MCVSILCQDADRCSFSDKYCREEEEEEMRRWVSDREGRWEEEGYYKSLKQTQVLCCHFISCVIKWMSRSTAGEVMYPAITTAARKHASQPREGFRR